MKGTASQLVEIAANREDSYGRLLSRATESLGIQTAGKKFSFFKCNTAQIPDANLSIKSRVRNWTLGNYLLAVKKAPSQIKFGVGCIEGNFCGTVSCIIATQKLY